MARLGGPLQQPGDQGTAAPLVVRAARGAQQRAGEGVGLLLVQSVTSADIPVMSAYLLLIALLFVAINLVVDLLYFAVDPRLRIVRGGGR